MVITDPVRKNQPDGKVFEGPFETNNTSSSDDPLIIELPPPSDLQVADIVIPSAAKVGEPISIDWSVQNFGDNPALGRWSDALYLSTDSEWDINDPLIGRLEFTAPQGGLPPGERYTQTLEADLPPAKPGTYRVIVRPDIFNEVYEQLNEANNRTASPTTFDLTVERLQLGVPFDTTLDTGQERLFEVEVGLGQTLVVSIGSGVASAANEIFARFDYVPTGVEFDASYEGPLSPNQVAVVPSTQPGKYYVLVRGQSEPEPDTEVTVLARVLPFDIINVVPDVGGDSKFVTTTILGAQFHPEAIVKLVRPGIHEIQPVRYEVVDSTKIIAIFDLTGAERGLYDVTVINPNGDQATVPYRYLIERALEPDVTVGLGGPRVLAPGSTGFYGVSVLSQTNVDTRYTHFTFGVPELGLNPYLFNLPYVVFASNLRGAPEGGDLEDVPFASLISDVNTDRLLAGETLAPGYVFDLPTQQFAGRSFSTQIYPGLLEILKENPNALDGIEDEDIAFTFHLVASATSLTPEEFVAQQTTEALALRQAVLDDPEAPLSLLILAADPDAWVGLYLQALEDAELLRPEDVPPPVREDPLVVSLLATFATGLLAGPGGEPIVEDGDLLAFFEQVRRWYHHDPDQIGSPAPPPFEPFDLGTSRQTHFESFKVFVPFGEARVDIPPGAQAQPVSFASFLEGEATGVGNLATLVGPFGFGAEQFVPLGEQLPYTVYFENSSAATSHVGEIRIVTQLDPILDVRRFRLGDIKIGDITVNLPQQRGAFAGEFDFAQQLGFILRINAGLDIPTNTATWLIQAIDPETGEVVQDPGIGLLPPNDADGSGAGFVTYTTEPLPNATTGATVEAQARVLFNTAPPEDTERVVHTVDAVAPTTELSVTPLTPGGADFLLEWTSDDDEGGSEVGHATVYVAENGGNFRILSSRTTETSLVFEGESGTTYEFLVLATDNAGNRERPPFGVIAPDDGSGANLGSLPEVLETTMQDLGDPPAPDPQPSTNELFLEAQALIPTAPPSTSPSEFDSVIRPFVGRAFATGIGQSFAGIGPMAIALFPDGSLLASGGLNRGSLYRFGIEGGEADEPITTLPHPVFDMELADDGALWATTGGGPLLQLDPDTGRIIQEIGEGITQTLAIDPATGLIYLSSYNGIEIFDPVAGTFEHFSDTRVGNLAFAPNGELWGAVWPQRGQVVRFDSRGRPEPMLRLDSPVDSLAFGQDGTRIENLLFVSNNSRRSDTDDGSVIGGELVMVDLTTLQRVAIATGGTRGDIVQTTTDGRVLLSHTNQIDVISPVIAPRVAETNPPHNAIVALPRGFVIVTFDQDMNAADPATLDGPGSVLNPANFTLTADNGGAPVTLGIQSASYDSANRSVTLLFDALSPDIYTLEVFDTVESDAGVPLAEAYSATFTAVSDFSPFVALDFYNSRSQRSNNTISYDLTITNTSQTDLLLPMVLVLDPSVTYNGVPQDALPRDDSGVFFIDLSVSLPPDGRLKPGESTFGRTVTILNPDGLSVDLGHSVSALPYPNEAPVFITDPITAATAGQAYSYPAIAEDPDGIGVIYLLIRGPEGMAVDPVSGLVTWSPGATGPAEPTVVLQAYDIRGGVATQEFVIEVDGANHVPWITPPPSRIVGAEGEPLQLILNAIDEDGDPLIAWGDNLPPGATVDPDKLALQWVPGFNDAGTYERVTLYVSDGIAQASVSLTVLVLPTNQPPQLIDPADRTLLEGETIRLRLRANDPEGDPVTFSSEVLPAFATLDPNTGLFEWTPAFIQAGEYDVPFTADDGRDATTHTAHFTVINVNAPPEFDAFDGFTVQEGQLLGFSFFAFDPDNPAFVPFERDFEGDAVEIEAVPPTVTYTFENLPEGATTDTDTTFFDWIPDYNQAGQYAVTVIATDDGDGTGVNQTTRVTVPITVLNTNRPPVIDPIDNTTVQRGDTLLIPVSTNDEDGNPITLELVNALVGFNLPGFISFADHGDGTGLITLAPGFGDRGDHTITLVATDDGDAAGNGGVTTLRRNEFTFVVTVDSLNETPILAVVGDKVAVTDQTLRFNVRVHNMDEDALFFEAIGLPGTATFTPSTTYGEAVFEWTPTDADLTGSPYTLTIRVTDSGNGVPAEVMSDEETIDIVVRDSNAAPVLLPVGDREVDELDTLTIALSAQDADGDPLTYAVVNAPAGSAFDAATGLFTWEPNIFSAGDYGPIIFAASDGLGSSFETIAITVHNTNQAPQLTPLPVQSSREDTPLQFTVVAGDVDGGLLTFNVITGLPDGASFDPATGQFNWTAGFEQAGEYVIRFGVSDPDGLTDELDVTVRIDNVNRAPTLEVENHKIALGEPLSFTLIGADPDLGATLTYSAVGLPGGASLDPDTGAFHWVPSPGQVGDFVITFAVSDGRLTTQRAALIRASVEPEPPDVTIVLTPGFPPIPGQTVVINALADSLASI
ncbi:MAG: putative Ig domain-containing protein, partial [Planctomycetota bacterium]